MPSKRVPSYRRHKPTGQAVVTLGGKDHYLGQHNTTASRAAYDELVGRWLAGDKRTGANRNDLTVMEIIAQYWRFAERYYTKNGKPNTEAANIRSALRRLKSLYGTANAPSFGPCALNTVRDSMVQEGHCRGHVNKQTARIKRMFRWAVENELIPPAVYHGLQAVAGLKRGRSEARETEPVRPVSDEYVDAIEPFVSAQVWALVELGPRAQAIVKPFLKSDLDAFLFSPRDAVDDQQVEKWRGRKSKVQPSQRNRSRPNPKRRAGNRYTPDSYRRAIRRASDLADANAKTKMLESGKEPGEGRIIPRWHPHQLRHTNP